ncbi:MAG: hypothetical protein HUJ94_02810 [Bacteroidales bacterium]|nr:hypothetical protein [Bacteroidales bacterium]
MEEAHANGLLVNIWLAENPERVFRMCQLGVDFMTTDKPEYVRSLIESY